MTRTEKLTEYLRSSCSEWGICGCDSNVNHHAAILKEYGDLEHYSRNRAQCAEAAKYCFAFVAKEKNELIDTVRKAKSKCWDAAKHGSIEADEAWHILNRLVPDA